MPQPPETEQREVVETLHGEEVRDPYRWLEDDDEEVAAWVARQNEYTDEQLRNEAREALEPRFRELADVPNYGRFVPRERGYFQRVESTDEDRARLLFRPTLDDEPRVLADPNEWPEGESLDWFLPSPDGSLVAYGVAEGGDENYDVVVLDVDTGDVVDEICDCGRTFLGGIAWGDSGLYYVTTGAAGGGAQLDKQIRYHELGTEGTDSVLVDDVGRRVWPELVTDEGELVVTFREGWRSADVLRWTGTPESGELVPLVVGVDSFFRAKLRDGTVYLLTDYDAPRSRVLACDVDARDVDPDDLRQIVPQRDGTLQNFVFAGEYVVAHHQRDAHSSLTVYDSDGERLHDAALPAYAAVEDYYLHGARATSEFFFTVETFDRPRRVVRGDAETGETSVVERRRADGDADIVVAQQFFESADGTEVPAFVVHREGIDLEGDNPAVVYGYGGFRTSLPPMYDRFRTAFLEDGGVYVQANLRGGAEYGERWHREGMKENKQNVFDDFYAVAEGLVEAGYTRPERLAALGASNGGLLVGAALTQRPDLFGAAISAVPVLDMLRFHELLLGETWTTEYGSPEDPEAFEYLREYSPYHNVEERAYPATLFKAAAGDSRVHPAHARKMAARMQAANRGDAPVLLRVEDATGHGSGKSTSMRVREELDKWAFLYDRLDVLE
ncbi:MULTISPECIES: prolyl oligopeptidase family serine peptidase [Halorussus]|uniref:prolyl oligopeptidase family serine peptidase n=1 Tax=Halorussus TaxID=1070314 RepID=UPI00209DF14A|nr:prolyl oligopeptidase family serine peptidase [Halorussus vallis]USZ76458.1 prolyl oligopeptidase family serine peptidase [Halorussus vallis]